MKLDLEQQLRLEIEQCRSCPRLVSHREKIAREKRRAFLEWEYHGKPVPSFGKFDARLLLVGLAPGAHGANRTGRMFTGDSSGDFLYETLWRYGFCNQPSSVCRGDGLELRDAYITAAIHCAPPQNKPTSIELGVCRGYLIRELALLTRVQVVVALGKIAWDCYLKAIQYDGYKFSGRRPHFSHGAHFQVDRAVALLGSYHPSRQNTQTGRLTREMFASVFSQARDILAQG